MPMRRQPRKSAKNREEQTDHERDQSQVRVAENQAGDRHAIALDAARWSAAYLTARHMTANHRDNGADERNGDPAQEAENKSDDRRGAGCSGRCAHRQNSNLIPCASGSESE